MRPSRAGSAPDGRDVICRDYLVQSAMELGKEQQIAETILREPWPAAVRNAAKAMNPARGAIIGLSMGLSFWLCVFVMRWLVLHQR